MKPRPILLLLLLFLTCRVSAQWFESSLDLRNGYFLTSVEAIDSQTFIGHDGETDFFFTTNYGATFTKRIVTGAIFLGNIYHRSLDTGFVVDYVFKQIRSTSDAWQSNSTYIISDGVDTAFQGVMPWMFYYLNDQKAIALGDSSNGFLEVWWTENSGNSWTRAMNQSALIGGFKFDISYARIPKPWVSGDTLIVGLPSDKQNESSLLLKTYNGGKDWVRQEIPATMRFKSDLAFEDANRIIMSRNSYPGATTIARSIDGGISWDTTVKLIKSFQNITSVNNGDVTLFFASGIGSAYSGDFGETWEVMDNLNHRGLYFFDANHAISAVQKIQNGPGIRMFEGIFTSVASTKNQNQIFLYPNPFENNLYVETSIEEEFHILNRLGQVVYSGNLMLGQNHIFLDVKPGVYHFLTNSSSVSKKIIVY